jgi:DNA-binding transcriptional ArsR family regulator
MSQPAVSKHLKILERAGLISVGQDAQRRPRRLEGRPLAEVNAWLEQYREVWEANYRRLDRLLDELQQIPPTPTARKRARARTVRPRRTRH